METARQDYADALASLRQQMGVLQWATAGRPDGKLEVLAAATAGDDDTLLQAALANRPDVQIAHALVERARAALCLARADQIPIPALGPVYERNETGASFYGVTVSSPIPLLNRGATLVAQREAEYHRELVALEQTQQRITVQVKTSLTRWEQTRQSVARTLTILAPIQEQTARMQRLYDAGQTDVVKLLLVRQRWIEAANVQLDATWQATQAHADLLSALGGTTLLGAIGQTPPR